MLVLSALCVLLPLVASLDICDKAISGKLLAGGNRIKNLKCIFDNKSYWGVAVSEEGAHDIYAFEATFGNVNGNTVDTEFVFLDDKGKTVDGPFYDVYTLFDDHVRLETNSVYYFKCTERLIAGYRCQEPKDKGASGPKYFIWAAQKYTESDILNDLTACEAKINQIDAAARFVRRYKL